MKIFPITNHYVSLFASIQTDNKNKDKKEKWNSIVLKPLNPNVGLEDDTVKRKLFPTDEKFHELVCSDKFKELIQTDASTEEGQQRVAEYYDVKDAWEKSMASQKNNDDMSPSDTYYQLLKAVKCVSKRDNVWISFYEGLHRHSALILSLLSTTFNMRENNLRHKSLTSTYFKEHHLANYVAEEETPDARLSAIFKRQTEAKMITNKFRVRGLIPKQLGNEVHESKVHLLKDKARQFTEKIVKYSQIISEGKKTSADNSLPSLLMKAFKKSLLNSTPSQRNYKPSQINCESTGVATKPASPSLADKLLYNKTNWNVEPKYTILKDVTPGNHKTKMDQAGDDELKAYGWCNLLNTQEWKEYIRNPLNDSSRAAFIAKMTNSAVHPEYAPPPYGIYFESMAVSIGKIEKGVRHVDQRHLNGYYMIPMIVTILHAKKKNDTLTNVVTDEMNMSMINYICRYIHGMKGYNNNAIHPAVEYYLPGVKGAGFLNDCVDIYQILPVTVFLMTMYNACFMFQKEKDNNDLLRAMERVNLTPGLDDNTFFSTMSKFM